MQNLSHGQYMTLMCAAILSASLSVAGSTMIICMARRKLRHIYQRLVSLLSFADIVFSLSTIAQTILIPEEEGLPMAMGSNTSCTTIGFLFMWGLVFSPLYNCILSVYFWLVVRSRWREKDFLWKFEIPSHVLGVILPLILPIVALVTNSYAPSTTAKFCTYAGYPEGCQKDDEIECQRGEYSQYFNIANVSIVIAICIVGIIATFLVYWNVRWQLTRNIKYNFGASKTMDELSANHLKEVRTQAILYGIIFINSSFWPLLMMVLMSTTGGGVASTADESRYFVFLLFSFLLYPLAGALNVMVYIRPKYVEWRNSFSEYSSFRILKSIFVGESIEEHIRISKQFSRKDTSQDATESRRNDQEENFSSHDETPNKSCDTLQAEQISSTLHVGSSAPPPARGLADHGGLHSNHFASTRRLSTMHS